MRKYLRKLIIIAMAIAVAIFPVKSEAKSSLPSSEAILSMVPEYKGQPYVMINGNNPYFTADELTTNSYENYAPLDKLGRCGSCIACIGQDIMPTEERGNIGQVKPTGWHTVKYNGLVDGNYLYNRCHLIGYQLAGENANTKNLITGTRYLNVVGMLTLENMVANYVHATGNHVLYRVTPIFKGNNLVANGVLMEGYSVEDSGKNINFNVYAYNVQPGIGIDYATGESWLESDSVQTKEETKQNVAPAPTEEKSNSETKSDYVLNTNTKKFHIPSCSSVGDMKEKNKEYFTGDRQTVINRGFVPCKRCNP